MANFLFVYRGNPENQSKLSPDQMQQLMEKWRTWITQALQKGWMLDAGDALLPEGRVVRSKQVVTDGPFVEAKEIVGGFSIVKAETIEAASELAKGCPALINGGNVEVRTLAGMGSKL